MTLAFSWPFHDNVVKKIALSDEYVLVVADKSNRHTREWHPTIVTLVITATIRSSWQRLSQVVNKLIAQGQYRSNGSAQFAGSLYEYVIAVEKKIVKNNLRIV